MDAGTVYTNRTIVVIKNDTFIASPPVMKMKVNLDLKNRQGLFEHHLNSDEFAEFTSNFNTIYAYRKKKRTEKNQVFEDDDNYEEDDKNVEEDEDEEDNNEIKQEQLHPKEGNAICLLIQLIERQCNDWSFECAPDGIGADFIARHESFDPDMYIQMQMRSCCTVFGRTSTYYRPRKNPYPDEIYCVALGVLNYSFNSNPISCNDSLVKTSSAYEMFDIGSHHARTLVVYV